ncbi:MAG: gamma-glutamyltransferase [Caldilineaceae bacterium]
MVLKGGKPVLAVASPAAICRIQAALNLLLNHIEFGMAPVEAVTAPRFATDNHQDSFDPNPTVPPPSSRLESLTISDQIDGLCAELANRGHRIEVKGDRCHAGDALCGPGE